MTTLKELEGCPKINIAIDMYETSEPYLVHKNGTREYFTTFSILGSEVTNSDDEIVGLVKMPIGGGAIIVIGERHFYLAPDDLFYAVSNAIKESEG